jgi:hypothetical protein
MTPAARKRRDEIWGELGPAMRALPNDRWRAFVEHIVLAPPGYGAQANAYRRAGFGHARTTSETVVRMAWKLVRDERIQAAIAEESRKMLRAGAPEAVKALHNLIRNPDHKDHGKAIGMVLARTDPEIQRHDMNITHRVIDPDQESLEELRAVRALGATREKLIELFGENAVPRLERLEAQQAEKAKVIDGEVIGVDE